MKRTKKFVSAAICLICILLAGCSGNNKEKETDATDAPSTLSLYCMSDDARVDLYITAFKSFYQNVEVTKRTFNDVTQMDEQVKNELNAGKGPDIIIFPEKTSLDVLQMAANGAFKDLGDEMKQDEGLNQDDYLPGTFTAGKLNEKVYILPLTFTIPTVLYDSNADLGVSPELVTTYEQFLSSLESAVERFQEEQDYGAVYFADILGPLLSSTQAYHLSFDQQTVTFDDQALKEVIDIVYLTAMQRDQVNNILSMHGSKYIDFAGRFAYWYDSFPDLSYILWLLDGAYNKRGAELGISVFGQPESKQVVANIISYGAATKNAGSYAYEFLRAAMDCNAYSSPAAQYGMSLNKTNIEAQINVYKSLAGNVSSKGEQFELKGLGDDKSELLRQIYGSITDVQIYNYKVVEMFYESVLPYYDGQKSYEECIKDFKQKMNLYVAE